MKTQWIRFWFEGNQTCGWIESPEDWEKVKEVYKEFPVDLAKAQRNNYDKKGHDFGFRREHQGKETLGEFFKKHRMKIR